jgi:hypothetical protein
MISSSISALCGNSLATRLGGLWCLFIYPHTHTFVYAVTRTRFQTTPIELYSPHIPFIHSTTLRHTCVLSIDYSFHIFMIVSSCLHHHHHPISMLAIVVCALECGWDYFMYHAEFIIVPFLFVQLTIHTLMNKTITSCVHEWMCY